MDIPSKLYIKNDIKCLIKKNNQKKYFHGKIQTGDLLISINNIKVQNLHTLAKILIENKNSDTLTITFFKHNINLSRTRIISYYQAKIPRIKLSENIVQILKSAVLITYVKPNGASARAGIESGDYLIRINGKTFKNAIEANDFILKSDRGSYLNYELLRNNKTFTCKVELVKYHIEINNLIMYFIGLIFLFFGSIIGLLRPKYIAARLMSIAFIFLGYYLSWSLIDNSAIGNLRYYFIILLFFVSLFGISIFIHAAFYFPTEKKAIIKAKFPIIIPYAIAILLFVLEIINIGFLKHSINFISIIIINVLRYAILIAILYYLLICFVYRKKIPNENKIISKPIRKVYYLIVLLSVFLVIAKFIFDSINPMVFSIYIFSILLLPASYVYVIGKYQLLDLEVRLRKNIQFIIMTGIWKLLLLGLIIALIWIISNINYNIPNLHFTGTSIEILDHPLPTEKQDVYQKVFLIVLSIIGFFIFRYLNKKGKNLLDKKFFRTKFNYKKASNDFSEILIKNIGIQDLSEKIIKELSDLSHFKRASIIFYKNENEIIAQKYFGLKSETFTEFCNSTIQKQIEIIKQIKSIIYVDELSEPLRTVYKEHRLKIIVPIFSKDKILGALLIGEKLSETAFHFDDIEFLNMIASQISVALENAFLYEELTSRERIKHELDLARKIQLLSLPESIPDVKGLDVSGMSIPAYEVGGDFYDYLSKDEIFSVIVGDVSGKGTSAALYMSKAQGIMRTLYEFDLSPKQLLVKSNNILYKYLEKSSFISSICSQINTENKTITIARAGHLPMYYYNKHNNKITPILPKGVVLGMAKNTLFEKSLEEINFNYNIGDIFLFVTDGVIEARNKIQEDYQVERLLGVFKQSVELDSARIRLAILNSLNDFVDGAVQFDDITIVVVKVID